MRWIGNAFFYIRHADPIYNPDSLTPLGIRQAEALAKRLAQYGLDKVYSSTSNRAIMTAQPTCELLKMEPELLEFAKEIHAFHDFHEALEDGRKRWIFQSPYYINLFHEKEIRDLGNLWYNHPAFEKTNCKEGIIRIYEEADRFFANLGYEHLRYTGKYKVTRSNNQRVAFFAHAGFGMAFLSSLLDIPYPVICSQFGLSHSSITVIDFIEQDGYCIPKVVEWNSDSHLDRENLPSKFMAREQTILF